MTTHLTGTRDEWLAARRALLDAEKALTRQSDELARRRAALASMLVYVAMAAILAFRPAGLFPVRAG